MVVKYLDISTATERLGLSERRVRQMCSVGQLAGAVRKGKSWRIPADADTRLRGIRTAEQLSEVAELSELSETKRRQVAKRVGVVTEFERFASDWVSANGKLTDALEVFASDNKVSVRTLRRWQSNYRSFGATGLIDSRGGRVTGLISPEAWELFKSFYLTQRQLSVKVCWTNVKYINNRDGMNWLIPSLRTMQQYASERIPLPVRILHREGLAAYEAKCAPYIQTDPETIEPGAVWIGDHHEFNCWVRYRGKWVRPWLTAWEDMRSRTLMGWCVTVNPNQTTIMTAMKRGIEKYGPPESVKIDNGKDYDSELWTGTTKQRRRKAIAAGYIDEQLVAGIYAMMNIGVSFAIPYHPQSKAVERYFDTLDQQLVKTIKTYCGKDSARKPDALNDYLKTDKAVREALSMDEFAGLIDRYINDIYNQQGHTGRGMEGRAPVDVLATRDSRRVLSEGVLELLLRIWSGELKVGKNGVNFKGLWYGQYNPELLMRQGQKVRVAYDPDDLATVHVYDATTMRLICEAAQAKLVGYGGAVSEEDLREGMKQKGRALRVVRQAVDSRLTANMDVTDVTLAAMAERIKQERAGEGEREQQRSAAIKPVSTPLDDQVGEHARQKLKRISRKAAGAENDAIIDMDLSMLNQQRPSSGIELFSDE